MKTVTIAFDVDGTLRCNHKPDCKNPNYSIVIMFNILAGFKNTEMYVWSGGGADYAKQKAREFGLKVRDNHCISKIGAPQMDIAIDDMHEFALGKVNLIVRRRSDD